MGVWAWPAAIGSVVMVLWALKSTIAYHTWTLDQMVNDIKTSPMPLNDAGVEWFKGLFKTYTDPKKKQGAIRLHMKVALFISTALLIQLMQVVRKKVIPLHRWNGRITIVFALLALPTFVRLVHGFPGHIVTQYLEYCIIPMIAFFGLRGWWQIRNKQVMDHRASMIMFSACFFFFGVQRIILLLFRPLHSGPWAQYTPLGPWQEWKGDAHNYMLEASVALAFPLTFGVAGYNAYVAPHASKPKAS